MVYLYNHRHGDGSKVKRGKACWYSSVQRLTGTLDMHSRASSWYPRDTLQVDFGCGKLYGKRLERTCSAGRSGSRGDGGSNRVSWPRLFSCAHVLVTLQLQLILQNTDILLFNIDVHVFILSQYLILPIPYYCLTPSTPSATHHSPPWRGAMP